MGGNQNGLIPREKMPRSTSKTRGAVWYSIPTAPKCAWCDHVPVNEIPLWGHDDKLISHSLAEVLFQLQWFKKKIEVAPDLQTPIQLRVEQAPVQRVVLAEDKVPSRGSIAARGIASPLRTPNRATVHDLP